MLRLLLITLILLSTAAHAQRKAQPKQQAPAATSGSARMQSLSQARMAEVSGEFADVPARCIGPSVMGGRVVDLEVNPADPTHFFVAYASGGLWVTHNNGVSFEPVFDHEAVMTIGDIAVDWNHQQVIWVGTGEVNSSRSSYSGIGVYKILPVIQSDGSLKYKAEYRGLEDSQHIGKILVHPTDPNCVWVASMGPLYSEGSMRGVYKTNDGGITWSRVLDAPTGCGAIDLVMDPLNANTLYVALWNRSRKAWNFVGNGEGSAILQTTDAGRTWKNISHNVDDKSAFGGRVPAESIGRIGLALHHSEGANRLYAFIDNQQHRPDTAMKKTEDGLKKDVFLNMSNAAFEALSDSVLNQFLRDYHFDDVITAVSMKADVRSGKLKPSALYDFLYNANEDLFNTPIVGAEVYAFDVNQASWKRTHEDYLDDVVFTYGYYFGMIRVSPIDVNKVYIAGVPIIKSNDGGANWQGINPGNVHVDHHALWINPANPKHIINGSDGGVQISYDDGKTYVNCNSPAVGQFYTVQVDESMPYRVFGGLQDNGVWYASSRAEVNDDWRIGGRHPFSEIMSGDGMQVMVDTRDNNTVYTGYQFGNYTRVKLKEEDYTDLSIRHTLGERPLRWNWQTPILLSKFNQDILYICSNKVHRSTDGGEHFTALSGDLTHGEHSGDVPFGTLTSIAESPLQFGLLAVGSDDGRVHVSPDNGYTWNDVSAGLPTNLWVTRLIFSAHQRQRLYVTLNGYRQDHFVAYIFKSDDLGRTWQSVSGNMPLECINVIREDSKHEHLLYVGSDHGLYVSIDGGVHWNRMSKSMPEVAVHDLVVQEREEDLVVATHGRSLWILDIEDIRAATGNSTQATCTLLPIRKVHKSGDWGGNWSKWLEPEIPHVDIVVYSNTTPGKDFITVAIGDSLVLHTLDVPALHKGLNYIPFDLTLPEAFEKPAQDALNTGKDAKDFIRLKRADNGKYYLPKGKYKVTYACDLGRSTAELVIE
jgi:photosystem II stability/assembly factor-like uncharacterized protein